MGMAMLGSLATSAISMFVKQSAMIINLQAKTPEDQMISVQFNPAEYSLIEGANYTEMQNQKANSPVVNFAGGKARRLKMTLYFDSYHVKSFALDFEEEKDVSEQVEKLMNLRQIAGKGHRPPEIVFVWGSLRFQGVINSITATYTMFAKSGKPLRAKVDVEFVGLRLPTDNKKSPFESPDRTKIRVLTEDESLWNIAQHEYGEAGMWRYIAEANGIMDPLAIPVGTVLKVPAL